jgi:multicomponent Na+:H+ antiporter subunit C
MTATLYGLCSAALVGLGLYGLIVHPEPLRKMLAFNLIGGGVFLLLGVVARRGAAMGFGGDPVPQALIITGLVVAFASTAVVVALLLRFRREDEEPSLLSGAPTEIGRNKGGPYWSARQPRADTSSFWRSSCQSSGYLCR